MKYISRLWAPVSRRGARLARSLRSAEGYSLLEIMIVIVIIGVLALIAIPKFMGVTARAQDKIKKRVEAKTMLKQVTTLQQAHLY
jgi:prepilin-type N-terminal cleavage/methylation domain-containing protein